MKRRLIKMVVLALLLGATGMTFAKDRAMLIDQIPLLKTFSAQTALDDSQHKEEQAHLKEGVVQGLKGKYRVIAQHFYIDPVDQGIAPEWVQLRPDVGNFISQKLSGKGEYETIGTVKGGPPIAVFKVGFLHPERMALAMSHLKNGDALVGYFEVEKE